MDNKEKEGRDEGIVGEIVAPEEEQSEVDTLAQLNALYVEKIKSQAAEFENFRNRTVREMGQMFDRGVREVVLELLPIVDNFGLAMKNVDASDGFAAGVLMIQNQLTGVLEKLGVIKIEAVGAKFDTKYHAAVSHIEDENLGESVVTEELQAGYVYKDAVIRHATVVVAN